MPLTALEPILERSSVQFFSLQVGARAQELQLGYNIQDLSPYLSDFACTAAAIGHLDLVITVDTAVAHLAGALNKLVWVLLDSAPDWRWELKHTQTHWYASMRLFRQQEWGRWEDPVQAVAAALDQISVSSIPP